MPLASPMRTAAASMWSCGWALDRLGRSLVDLIGTLQELDAAHVDLFLEQQSVDTTVPAGRLFFHMFGAFAPGPGIDYGRR
jgi:DNA invertase Pin-like site-specific DNA recombinase